MTSKKIRIVTHDGKFHSDDVFAVAALWLFLGEENVEVVRTRDSGVIATGEYIVDVGGEYDPACKKFDHHQVGGAGQRDNTIPYASFGLVWKEFGPKLCGSDEIARRIDKKVADPLDAIDNGTDISKSLFEGVRDYAVYSVVDLFRPTWKETSRSYDGAFLEAARWAKWVLAREIEVTRDWIEAEEKVVVRYDEATDRRLILFGKDETYGREVAVAVLEQRPEPLYVVLYRPDAGNWQVAAVNENENTFKTRKPFPETWHGLRGEKLTEVSGVPDAVFCHRNGFMCIARSKEGAIKLAELALEA